MNKFLKRLGIAYGVAKRFDLEEIKAIYKEIKLVVDKFKQLKEDGLNVEEGIEIVQDAVKVYDVIMDAYND